MRGRPAGSDGGPGRTFVQSIDGGPPRPITRPGTSVDRVSPDGRYGTIGDSLLALDEGSSVPLRGVGPGDLPIRFSSDGRKLFLWRWGELPAKVYRVDLDSGRREVWRALMPADPAGIVAIGPVQITPDGRTCAFTYGRLISNLYLVGGLK